MKHSVRVEHLSDYHYHSGLARDREVIVIVKSFDQLEKNQRALERLSSNDLRPDVIGGDTLRNYTSGIVLIMKLDRDDLDPPNSIWQMRAREPSGADFYGHKMVLSSGNQIILFDFGSNRKRIIENKLCAHLHTVVFSADGKRVLACSCGFDMLLEVDIQTEQIVWEWCAWEHGYDRSPMGHYLTRDRTKANELKRAGKEVILVEQTDNWGGFGLPTRHRATHINGASYTEKGDILATLFHQGTAVLIDKKSGEATELYHGLRAPHAFTKDANYGYRITNTKDGGVLLLSKDFRLIREIRLSGLLGVSDRRLGLGEWLQCVICIDGSLYAGVDIHRSKVHLFDTEKRTYRSIIFPEEWAVQKVISLPRGLHPSKVLQDAQVIHQQPNGESENGSYIVLEQKRGQRLTIEEILNNFSREPQRKEAVVIVDNSGRGKRQGLLSLISGSKGDIRILGKRLKDVAVNGITPFVKSLPEDKWVVYMPSDTVIWTLSEDATGLSAKITKETDIVVLGYPNLQNLRYPPFLPAIWVIRRNRLEDFRKRAIIFFTKMGVKRSCLSDYWYFLIRPCVLSLPQWQVAVAYDEFGEVDRRQLWNNVQDFAREFKSVAIPLKIAPSNFNSPLDIYALYQKLLDRDSPEKAVLAQQIKNVFQLSEDSTRIYDRVTTEGPYLIRNSILKVPEDIELRLERNVVIDDSIIDIHAEAGETVIIPEGTMISNSRISGRLSGKARFGFIYRVISDKGVDFRERSVQVPIFLKDGRTLLGIMPIGLRVKDNLYMPIEGLEGLSMRSIIENDMIDINRATGELEHLLSQVQHGLQPENPSKKSKKIRQIIPHGES